MGQTNYMKLVWIAGFLLFAGISCWATAESLHLLLPTWPKALWYVVTVGIFIIASLGTKMIVDSLSKSKYCENPGLKLTGGVLILLIFWLAFSMPTNAHTFMWRNMIGEMVNQDVSTTQGYLSDIQNNQKNTVQAQKQIAELKNNVDLLLGELKAEIENEANPGFGKKSNEILRKFATLLSVDKIEPLSFKGTSRQDREKLYDAYRTKIYLLADTRAQNITKNILSPNPASIAEAKTIHHNLDIMKKSIADGSIDLNKAEDVTNDNNGVCSMINKGYNSISKNRDFVSFKSEHDKNIYLAEPAVTQVRRLVSVVDVWRDFLGGKFAGLGFGIWVMLSVLVDIAAFIFFGLAFKN